MKSLKGFLTSTITRNVFSIVLPVIIGGLFSWLFSREFDTTSWFIIIGIVLCISFLIFVSILTEKTRAKYLAAKDDETAVLKQQLSKSTAVQNSLRSQISEDERQIEEMQYAQADMQERIDIRQELIGLIKTICFERAIKLKVSSEGIDAGHAYENLEWNFKRACETICEEVLSLVKKTATVGNRFSVSYTATKTDGTIHTIAYKGFDRGCPKGFPNGCVPKAYFSSTQFRRRDPSLVTFRTPEEISERPPLVKQQESVAYQQYIGIPVGYNGEPIVGFLEIIAYEGSEIAPANTSDLMSKGADIFLPVGRLLLLVTEIDHILQKHQSGKTQEIRLLISANN